MKLITQSPKQALKSFLKQRPLESERDLFKKNLIELLDKISVIEKMSKEESEEHLKNDIRDFLLDTYYKETNAINTKDKKDLVIYENKRTDSDVLVIIEAKRPSNINEMLTADKPNRKALHELILYYLNERKAGNFKLKNLVATNIYEWFIIDANQFDKYIYTNSRIRELHETKANDKKTTPFFYEEVAKLVDGIDAEIPCIHFDIRDYEGILRNSKKENDKELVALYKILSPQHLLKIATPNDSNTLNEKFYKELLHIIGLEEAKESGKYIIRRKEKGRNAASLIELAIEALTTEDTFHHIPDIRVYGENKEEQIFNIALELCITWINRILFLKLLEGQLISYHSNTDYKFLNSKTIHDFDELFKLFHKVLAVNIDERTEAIKAKYSGVPYLNSSLFEISDLEDQTIKINSLENDGLLELISTTVLKDIKKKEDKLPTLNYLFSFLDSYDFASEGAEDWQKDNRPLINASVLGKVFEKINGYKDGSIFTPAFITMYMCRQSLRLAVTEKFNEALSEEGKKLFDKFDDIKNYTAKLFKTDEILKANSIINSLHICDPAVGSGHFLVSALNELIVIKAELGILADEKGNTIGGYEFEVVNDELTITDPKGNSVEYKLQNGKPAKEIQRLQRTLFHEKQKLIENCLFGVDINPKSVLICRLRLWIELLKNAYYKEPEYTELETLPNIDINIKCGNSLLSRFALDADLSKALKSIKYDVKAYRGFVNDYKNEKSRDVKRGLQKIIDNIKNDFRTEISNNDPKKIRLKRLSNELYLMLSVQNSPIQADVVKGGIKREKEKRIKLETEISKLSREIEDIKTNAIYKNAFEWRFEFPEVINNDGEFEGFDVVIGNPPYISAWEMYENNESIRELMLQGFSNNKNLLKGHWDLYVAFILLSLEISKSSGYCTFIIPNPFLREKYAAPVREYILKDTNLLEITLFEDSNVFDDVARRTIIFSLSKSDLKDNSVSINITDAATSQIKFKNKILKSEWEKSSDFRFNVNADSNIFELIDKIEKASIKLGNLCYINYGAQVSSKEKGGFKKSEVVSKSKQGNAKKFIEGKDVHRWSLNDRKLWLDYRADEMYGARFTELFESPKLLFRKVSDRGHKIAATIDENNFYTDDGCVIAVLFSDLENILPDESYFGYEKSNAYCDLKFILAQILSSVTTFYFKNKFSTESLQGETSHTYPKSVRQLPIVLTEKGEQKQFIDLVDKILSAKQNGNDSSNYEKKINELIYSLYELTKAEIRLVENS